MSKTVIVCLLCAVGLISCKDPQKPAAANFKPAIDEYLAKQPPLCIGLGYPLPLEITDSVLQMAGNETAARVSALESAGLLHSEAANVKSVWFGQGPGKKFDLTDDGKRQVSASSPNDPTPQQPKFCFGTRAVHSIEKWSNPDQGDNVEVTYTYQLNGVPDWAKRPDVQKAFGMGNVFVQAFDGSNPRPQTITMVRTNQGWEVFHP